MNLKECAELSISCNGKENLNSQNDNAMYVSDDYLQTSYDILIEEKNIFNNGTWRWLWRLCAKIIITMFKNHQNCETNSHLKIYKKFKVHLHFNFQQE